MKNLFFILLVLIPFLGHTQNATIKGMLVDELGIRVADANIVVEGTEIKSFTDKNGKFDFFVPANTPVTLVFSHITYKKKKLTYLLSEGQVKVIYPVFKYRVLPEFTVTTKRTDETIETLINIKGVEIPSIGNFESRLGSEMGVTMNNELSSGYNVRGGNFEENLIYVNGIEIYRPFLASSGQQEGLSFINSNMVEDIQFSAGGFQARYGDKLSSVLDVTYKKPTETGGSVTLSMLGANLHFEGISENFLWTHVTAARFQSNSYVFGALDT